MSRAKGSPPNLMDKSASKHSYAEMVNVYVGDEISHQVTREHARELKAAGTHYFTSHGKAIKLIGSNTDTLKTQLESAIGWTMPFGRMRSSALNEGRAGQFPIGYPIPYAFEGHLKSPRVDEINFVPQKV